MTDIRRILCAIDFSDCSRHALAHAVALARWHGAGLTVLHVREVVVVPEGGVPYPGALVASWSSPAELAEEVRAFVEPMKGGIAPFDTAVEEGRVARTIVLKAAEIRADLLVIGTHGRGGFEHLVLGSVAEKVLRKAACPVLIVPPAVPDPEGAVQFTRILCPVDFGTPSMQALSYGLSLAQEAGAKVTVLHVLEPLQDEARAVPVTVPEYRRLREEDAWARLRNAIPEQARDWCQPVGMLAYGKPYREILRVAHQIDANLLIMGVDSGGALGRLLFGSTAHHVVREAPCPVLTLRGNLPARLETAPEARQPVAARPE